MKIRFKRFLRDLRGFFVANRIVFLVFATTSLKFIYFKYWLKITWPVVNFFYGQTFSIFVGALLFVPFLFLKPKHKDKVIWLDLGLSLLLVFDMIYYSYFEALPTIGLWNTLGQTSDIGASIGTLLHYWYLLFFVDVLLVFIFRKKIIHQRLLSKTEEKSNARFSVLATSFVAAVIFALAIFGPKTLSIKNAYAYGYDAKSITQLYGVLTAHALDIGRYVSQETTHLSSAEKQKVVDWVRQNKPIQNTDQFTGVAKGKNIIAIQVESLGGFVVDGKVNGQEVTPNLNKLEKSSYYFPGERFVIGAGHTADTDFVVNSSFFPMNDAAVFVRFSKDSFTSLPKVLSANGYTSFAYHGYNRNFWNRNSALSALGFKKFYAAENYPRGTVLNMGLNDGDFLAKTAEYIKSQPTPSYNYVITLSSHVPFDRGSLANGLNINSLEYPPLVGGYFEDINYVDAQLGKFFEKLKAEGIYDDSSVLVYGDHTPVLPAFKVGTISYDPSSVQEKEVPLFIKLPGQTTGETKVNVGTHLDIMPTILDLVGAKTSDLMFGKSLFSDSTGYKSCPNQLAIFASGSNCESTLAQEQSISAKIIRYNLFGILK